MIHIYFFNALCFHPCIVYKFSQGVIILFSICQSLKRNHELASPNFKLSKQKKDSSGRKSWPSDLGKPRKRKRAQYEGELSTPVKFKSRGGWATEHPGDLPRQKARNRGWKSPTTPSSKPKKFQKASGGDYSLNSRSPRKFRKFQSNNST